MSLPLQVVVGKGKHLASSQKIYCEVDVLDDAGRSVATQRTTYCKGSSNPSWNSQLKFLVDKNFTGIVVRCWEKHMIFKDKFLGIITIKFNKELISGDSVLDDWFPLSDRTKSHHKQTITGQLYLKVIYGDPKRSSATPTTTPTTKKTVSTGKKEKKK